MTSSKMQEACADVMNQIDSDGDGEVRAKIISQDVNLDLLVLIDFFNFDFIGAQKQREACHKGTSKYSHALGDESKSCSNIDD